MWDALFVEAFAARLAFECAEDITQSTSKKDIAWQDYKQALREAKLVDAIENPPEPLPDDAWLLSRM